MRRNHQHLTESAHAFVDWAIAAIAGGQQGLITTRQLLALGLSEGSIAHRVRIGRLHRLYRGVYAVGHVPVSPYARALAAVVACGPDAVLSYGSAATLWGIDKDWRSPLEVTTRSSHQRHDGSIRIHRSKTLTPDDITVHFGVAVTSPARTVYDNAPRLTDPELAGAVNELRVAHFMRLGHLAEVLERHPQTRAAKRLSVHLVRPQQAPTRSKLERDFQAFVARYGLPEPLINTDVAGNEADVFFPEHKLVVEVDGWETHSSRSSFESDRDRDAERLAQGISTVRITKARIHSASDREAERLHAILRQRP